jgi:hypothetical protein
MRRSFWVGLAAVGLIAAGIHFLSSGGTAAPAPAAENQFAGKILWISCKNGARGTVLENVSFRQIAGKAFIVGKCLDSDERGTVNPWAGALVWLAVDDVVQIMEFKTADELKKALRAWDEIKKTVAPAVVAPAAAPGTGF